MMWRNERRPPLLTAGPGISRRQGSSRWALGQLVPHGALGRSASIGLLAALVVDVAQERCWLSSRLGAPVRVAIYCSDPRSLSIVKLRINLDLDPGRVGLPGAAGPPQEELLQDGIGLSCKYIIVDRGRVRKGQPDLGRQTAEEDGPLKRFIAAVREVADVHHEDGRFNIRDFLLG